MQLLSGRAAQKTKNESRKLTMYSKQWLPGDVLHVFYPIFWDNGRPELAVGAVWGHKVSDLKGLGLKTTFIPSTTAFDEDGQPIGQPDVTYQFSLIAKVFIDGKKALEEQALQAKKFPTEALRKEALKDLEDRYDTKNNLRAERPIIQRASYVISTEVISIKYANYVPDPKTIAHTSAPLSNDLINAIYSLMDNPKYAPQEGDTFFEVEWTYAPDPDKAQSGRKSKPAGLTSEYKLASQFPEAYKQVESFMPNVSMNAETIVRRATKSVDPAKVRAAIAQYSFMHSEDLDAADEENTEVLIRNVDLLKDLAIIPYLNNKDLAAKLTIELEKAAASAIPATPEKLPVPEVTISTPTSEAPTPEPVHTETTTQEAPKAVSDDVLQAMINQGAAEGAPNLQSLMSSQYNVGKTGDVLDGIDNDFV